VIITLGSHVYAQCGGPVPMMCDADGDRDVDLHDITAIASMLALQSLRAESTELDAPEPDGLIADCNATLSQEIFDIAVAEVEAIVQPDCIADDIGRESVTFVSIHPEIIHFRELSCQYPAVKTAATQ
jgi:hypothetical protein